MCAVFDKEKTTRDKTAETCTVNGLTGEWRKKLNTEAAKDS